MMKQQTVLFTVQLCLKFCPGVFSFSFFMYTFGKFEIWNLCVMNYICGYISRSENVIMSCLLTLNVRLSHWTPFLIPSIEGLIYVCHLYPLRAWIELCIVCLSSCVFFFTNYICTLQLYVCGLWMSSAHPSFPALVYC